MIAFAARFRPAAVPTFAILVAGLLTCGIFPKAVAQGLDPAMLSKLDAATFEVVAAKPTRTGVTYEKPLPLDLLPYQQRTDKYHSIGTAFALGHNRYVTAGHVLLTGLDSLWGPPELRDSGGHVYAIDKIEKFSLRKDFVVFSLATQPEADVALKVDARPVMNQTVYAVGNALGTGVVAREGLYTSNTPEQQDGEWKWIRFSAAASPGNSGGPLLDQNGKVIGVVLAKSPNENLNYALPISEVLNAPANQAEIDRRMPYQFDLFDTNITGTFKAQFALPLGLADFYARFLALSHTYVDGQLKALLAKEPDRVFPRGTGSHQALYGQVLLHRFPTLLKRDNAGTWEQSPMAGNSVKARRFPLPNNGYLAVSAVGKNVLFHLRKPDNVTDRQLYDDPTRLMDTLLGLGFMHRKVGSEGIKVTSLGKPALDTIHTDLWQRHWQVRLWPVPFANGRILVLTLPVPDGYDGIMRGLPASQEHDYLVNLEAMTNFLYVSYDGTLAQWKQYLKNTTLLPDEFKNIHIGFDYGKHFSYASPRIAFDFTPKLQKIKPNSELTLGFKYIPEHGEVVWNVADVRVKPELHSNDMINLARHIPPAADLDDAFKVHWEKIVQRQHPFDEIPFSDNDVMKVIGVTGSTGKATSELYTTFYASEGTHPQAYMKAKLDLLVKHLHVRE
ncbi:MAG TPA: trypsin-like peptidase domain-containing protein [Rhodanobacteraceae bacterium]|nr:trypsin-like peptidase domain-containing protein [Rhodanobacteraceae bacterium]